MVCSVLEFLQVLKLLELGDSSFSLGVFGIGRWCVFSNFCKLWVV